MTQEKVKDLVENLGLKAEELSDEVIAKIESYKDSLDKGCRLRCRPSVLTDFEPLRLASRGA